jgi:hypothetical protein
VQENKERTTLRSSTTLTHQEEVLWDGVTNDAASSSSRKSSNYEKAGSGNRSSNSEGLKLSLPFSFHLPAILPGSLHLRQNGCTATISYGIEVVAERPGWFKFNRRIGQIVVVAARPTTLQLEEAARLRTSSSPNHASGLVYPSSSSGVVPAGWDGEWTTHKRTERVRRWVWNEHSIVDAEVLDSTFDIITVSLIRTLQLTLPALSSLPAGIPIPVSLTITTWTKPRPAVDARPETVSDHAEEPSFPAPPANAEAIRAWLRSEYRVTAQPLVSRTLVERAEAISVFGRPAALSPALAALWPTSSNTGKTSAAGAGGIVRGVPVWVHEDALQAGSNSEKSGAGGSGMGRWRRRVQFSTTITLPSLGSLVLVANKLTCTVRHKHRSQS